MSRILGRRIAALALVVAMITTGLGPADAADDEPAVATLPDLGRTPPRLSHVDGEVSFWRPGSADWAPARVNTPLAAGDALYAAEGGQFEIQIGPRAFARAGADTQLALDSLEPDFLQLRVTGGQVAIDVRDLAPGHTIEIDTPQAAVTLERPGFYRVDAKDEDTTVVARRGGQAVVTPESTGPVTVAQNERATIAAVGQVETGEAPPLNDWDRWNYSRTDLIIGTASAKYVSPGVYGADELDRHGSWRTVAEYGPVWVPASVGAEWAPYTTGRWVWDPYYGWTWVDDAPWGWAPYHYGRWVFVGSAWAWAPGPVVRRPIYSPALVAFLGGGPRLGWVALCWGEPVLPWWGRHGFVGRPWWGGWGGPRVLNNVVVKHTTVVNVTNIHYRNTTVKNAVIAVPADHFGRGHVTRVGVERRDIGELKPLPGGPRVKPVAVSLVPETGRAPRPPEAMTRKAVVATREPRPAPTAVLDPDGPRRPAGPSALAPAPRIVPGPGRGERGPSPGGPREAGRSSDSLRLVDPQRPEPGRAIEQPPQRPGIREDRPSGPQGAAPPRERPGQDRDKPASTPGRKPGAEEPDRNGAKPGLVPQPGVRPEDGAKEKATRPTPPAPPGRRHGEDANRGAARPTPAPQPGVPQGEDGNRGGTHQPGPGSAPRRPEDAQQKAIQPPPPAPRHEDLQRKTTQPPPPAHRHEDVQRKATRPPPPAPRHDDVQQRATQPPPPAPRHEDLQRKATQPPPAPAPRQGSGGQNDRREAPRPPAPAARQAPAAGPGSAPAAPGPPPVRRPPEAPAPTQPPQPAQQQRREQPPPRPERPPGESGAVSPGQGRAVQRGDPAAQRPNVRPAEPRGGDQPRAAQAAERNGRGNQERPGKGERQ